MSNGSRTGKEQFSWFAGVDWGTKNHEVNVMDSAGDTVIELSVEHTATGLEGLIDRLRRLTGGQLECLAVATEVPRGAIVDVLLEHGAAVFSLNPKQLDRFRDRFSVAGAKDDRLDALVLASSLRTDRACFRRLSIDEPLVIRVRELARAEEFLQQEFMALTNRLRDLVHRVGPQWLKLSTNADDPWFWTLLEWAATPALGRRLRRGKIQRLLRSFRIRRISTDEVLAVLRVPPMTLAPGTVEAVTAHIQLMLPRVRLAFEQRAACQRELGEMLNRLAEEPGTPPGEANPDATGASASGGEAKPGDVAIMLSLPGVGPMVTAAFLADASPLLALRDYEGLRAVSGAAPVRRQTGLNKRGTITMRYACNYRLRNACYHWSRTSVQVDAAARQYYAALRARGHTHGRALRSVADRWLRILVSMLKTKTLYEPSRFRTSPEGAVQLAPASS